MEFTEPNSQYIHDYILDGWVSTLKCHHPANLESEMSKYNFKFISNMKKFKFCFPVDGKMICRHFNGSWIVLPQEIFKKRKGAHKHQFLLR